MSFERFGRISFTAQTKVGEFVEHLEKEGLQGTKCQVCGSIYFPPRADCCSCLSNDMAWHKVDGKGKLLSFTKAGFAPTGFEEDVPYVLAVADFDEVKVFGRFNRDFPEDKMKIGMPVKVEKLDLPDGQISYEFIPA